MADSINIKIKCKHISIEVGKLNWNKEIRFLFLVFFLFFVCATQCQWLYSIIIIVTFFSAQNKEKDFKERTKCYLLFVSVVVSVIKWALLMMSTKRETTKKKIESNKVVSILSVVMHIHTPTHTQLERPYTFLYMHLHFTKSCK